jgi:hypothetical protein
LRSVGTFVGRDRLRVSEAMKLRERSSSGPRRTVEEMEDMAGIVKK